MSFYATRIAELRARSVKIEEEIKALEMAEAASSGEENSVGSPSVQKRGPGRPKKTEVAAEAGVKRGRGRPKKIVTDATSGEVVKRGRGRPRKTEGDDEKSMSLGSLLMTIAQESESPLTSADFVTKARAAGYKTKSDNFGNMVYQALVKLVKDGKFRKNSETKAYEFIANAA